MDEKTVMDKVAELKSLNVQGFQTITETMARTFGELGGRVTALEKQVHDISISVAANPTTQENVRDIAILKTKVESLESLKTVIIGGMATAVLALIGALYNLVVSGR